MEFMFINRMSVNGRSASRWCALSCVICYICDHVLDKLKRCGLGCRLKGLLINAIMYADDLLLLSNSISDLQAMVDICVREFESTDLSINLQKSCGIRIGTGYKISVASISVNKVLIVWKSELKFLGVHILASSSFKC